MAMNGGTQEALAIGWSASAGRMRGLHVRCRGDGSGLEVDAIDPIDNAAIIVLPWADSWGDCPMNGHDAGADLDISARPTGPTSAPVAGCS